MTPRCLVAKLINPNVADGSNCESTAAAGSLPAVAPKAAMMDAGLTWLFDALGRAEQAAQTPHRRPLPRKQRS
jgi:hypothetical protein